MTQPHNTHTALPWSIGIDDEPADGVLGIEINTEDGRTNIGYVMAQEITHFTPVDRANSAFIVRACNSHYALLNVARAIHDTYFSGNPETFHTRLNENAGGDFAKILMVAIDSVTNGGGNG